MHTRKTMLSISCFMISAGLLSAAHAAQVDGKLQVKVNIGSAELPPLSTGHSA